MASSLRPVARREILPGLAVSGASVVSHGLWRWQWEGTLGAPQGATSFIPPLEGGRSQGFCPETSEREIKFILVLLPPPAPTVPALPQGHLDVDPCHPDTGTEEGLHRKLLLSSLVLLRFTCLLSISYVRTYPLIYRTGAWSLPSGGFHSSCRRPQFSTW